MILRRLKGDVLDDLPPKIRAAVEGKYAQNGFLIYNNWILDYQNRNASAVTIPNGIVGIGRGVFAEMYEITGEKRYLDLCEEILAVIRSVPTDVEGEIEYGRAGDEKTTDNVYVDGTGLCGIFLGRCVFFIAVFHLQSAAWWPRI